MKGILLTELKKEKVYRHSKMEKNTNGISSEDITMAEEYIYGLMETSMKENLKIIELKEREYGFHQMGTNIWEVLKTGNTKDMEF
jgi:hypothetical protein